MRFSFLGRSIHSEDGNVFIAIFGAIAMVGILGASVMTFMKGPLATSVKLTKINTAENQMAIGAQVAVMATASQPNNGDCETAPDGYVEPIEWRAATTEPIPTNGGLVPLSLGISKKDPWGTEYGYCVWNHGPTTSGAGCGANMLAGTNARIYPVVSIISAGPDKTFTTTCRDFATADANTDGDLLDVGDFPLVSKAADTDDDVITSFTYDEATGVSGGLWSIKSGDPATATIGKNIETTGTANLKGGLLLPDKALITCDATTAGVMAMNGTAIEICNGTTWDAITGGASSGSALSLTPNVSSGMDVADGDPSCVSGTCYSPNVTFTLTNNLDPAAASAVLVVTLSNTTNFEKVSDNCNGNSIAAGANCQIVVRAKANGNRSYSAILSITGNNSPLATLDGTSSGFGCTIGGNGPGGLYAGCAMGGYDLITTPSGCTATTSDPVCAGGADTLNLAAASVISILVDSTSGLQNTVDLMAYRGGSYNFTATEHCVALSYGGYDDWYNPSSTEMVKLYTSRALIGGSLGVNQYTTSNISTAYVLNINAAGGVSADAVGNAYKVRCVRRDPPAVFPAPTFDQTPAAVTFNPSSSTTAGETRTSNPVTVYQVTSPVTLSVSGGSGAQFSKNGGAYTSTSTTVTNGDTVTLRATSPVAGQEDTVSATIGSSSFSWNVRTVANNTIYAFVTAGTWNGNLGGLAGADAKCNAEAVAAGLGGSWIALLGTATADNGGPVSRAPWNWTTLKNMNNATVATSFDDLFDGTVTAPINRTASNGASASTNAWTGANTVTGRSSDGYICGSWSDHNLFGRYGTVNNITSIFYSEWPAGCTTGFPIYCMQDPAGGLADTDPAAVSIAPGVSFVSGAAALSNTVTVRAILQPVTVTLTPSAGTGDIYLNGVAQGATTITAPPNSTLQFSLTVPAVLGTKNTATITIGDDTYTWWAGYADSSREAKAFVTSSTYYASNLGGLSGADSHCNTAAASSSLGGLSSQWKALLSSGAINAADRIPWNWATLKNVIGTTIVAGGFPDLWDGSLANPLDINQNGATVGGEAWSGTQSDGAKKSSLSSQAFPWCSNWLNYSGGAGSNVGLIGTANNSWIDNHIVDCYNSPRNLYCIEDIDDASDTTPNALSIPYAIQVATSSRQTSSAVVIGGMSSGATQTLSVSATGGTPTFKVNGGAEVTSASVTNGDSIVFLMDAPATANSSNKMTITAGTMTDYWRVWTGWDGVGSGIKRVFVTSATYYPNELPPADSNCQTRATAAALGGTWKAILSFVAEPNWAVNRIGYNWQELQLVDATTVVYAPNLWSGTLLSPIITDEAGATKANVAVWSNTNSAGYAIITDAGSRNACYNWTTNGGWGQPSMGNSSFQNSYWIARGTGFGDCAVSRVLYCIEQ